MKNITTIFLITLLSGCYHLTPRDIMGMDWVNHKRNLKGINEMEQAGLRDGCQSQMDMRQQATMYRRSSEFAFDAQEIENPEYMFNWQYAGYVCGTLLGYEREYGRNILGGRDSMIQYAK